MNNIINLSFPVAGTELPADQNYRLLAAICRKFPQLHELEGLAIDTISGIPNKQGKITLTRGSRLGTSINCYRVQFMRLLKS
ncbi:MAG TPA: hypothetical protein IGS31_03140, partial [Oscillatoriales cyanobacterium M4454_W2019_049]|nr:hypothetical protein [Oscillatoriales cyanobacterium M4454_W2019_049]